MFVYLARPIDQAGSVSWLGSLTVAVRDQLRLAGIGAFLPSEAYQANTGDPTHLQWIDEMNTAAQFQSDALVAILPAGVATLGTPVEIERALMFNQPTLVLTDIRGSVQLAAWERAGATVLDLNDDDIELPTGHNLHDILIKVPRPDGTEAGSEHPNMLVKYTGGSSALNRAHATDAGLDLATSKPVLLHSGARQTIPTGVFAPPPGGWYGRITGRSSTLSKLHIQVHEGIIDAGYNGELHIAATYQGVGSIPIPAGTRLAQYILCSTWNGEVEVVNELPETARGDRGWGSSGS